MVFGLSENVLEEGCLKGERAIACWNQNVFSYSAFYTALTDIESAVWIVIEIHLLVSLFHTREI